MKFNPYELINEYDVVYFNKKNEVIANKDNWPKNLIYNPEINENNCTDEFNEFMWSDTTLTFYIKSAIGISNSLISRSCNYGRNNIVEHSDIHVIFLDDKPEEHDNPNWMTKTKTVVYIREKPDNNPDR